LKDMGAGSLCEAFQGPGHGSCGTRKRMLWTSEADIAGRVRVKPKIGLSGRNYGTGGGL